MYGRFFTAIIQYTTEIIKQILSLIVSRLFILFMVRRRRNFRQQGKCSHESGSGFGTLPAGLDLSSGKGIYSLLSFGGTIMRPCFQSSFACSIRSLRDETKFHQINRSPSGSPPSIISVVFSLACIAGSTPWLKTSICPAWYVYPEISTDPFTI